LYQRKRKLTTGDTGGASDAANRNDAGSQLLGEYFRRDAGLLQPSTQRSSGQFNRQGNNASGNFLPFGSLQKDVATALPNRNET
jgi:hypothetical protein